MEIVDKRKMNAAGEAKQASPEPQYDDFRPTLAGFLPCNDAVLLRELKLPDEGMIATPDAFAEQCLYAEVIAGVSGQCDGLLHHGATVRILKDVGHTIQFADVPQGQRYFTVNYQDIIGVWQ